jgi:hypothetical protein
MSLALPFTVRSYRIGKYAAPGVICTSTYDCNLYQCGNGSSVWMNAGGPCPGHLCNGDVPQPPYQSYLRPYAVHMQAAAPFPCY